MNNTSMHSELLVVSNEKLLDELKRRIDTGWMPTDSSYLADLVMSLVNAQAAVEAELARQNQIDAPVETVRQEAKPQVESGMVEIYDWLLGQGYSDGAARTFINQLPDHESQG